MKSMKNMKRNLLPAVILSLSLACALLPASSAHAKQEATVKTPEQTEEQKLYSQAYLALDAKKWAEAERFYNQSIALNPKRSFAWFERSDARGEQGDMAGAIADSDTGIVATMLLPEKLSTTYWAVPFLHRAKQELKRDEVKRALVFAVLACEAWPQLQTAWLARADANYTLGNYEQADVCLQKYRENKGDETRNFTREGARQNALKYKPIDQKPDTSGMFENAEKLRTGGKPAEAALLYSEMIEKNPFNAGAWINRGVCCANQDKVEEAVADYGMGIALNVSSVLDKNKPDNMAIALTNRSHLYKKQGRLPEAINDLELAIKLKPDYQKAIDLLKEVKESATAPTPTILPASQPAPAKIVAPPSAEWAALIGQAETALGSEKWVEGERLCSQAIVLDSQQYTAWLQRGYARGHQNKYDEAISDCSSGLILLALSGTNNPHHSAIGLTNRATYWLGKNEPLRALIDTISACNADETFALGWVTRADAQYALGNLTEANFCFQKARALDSSLTRTFTEAGARANAVGHKTIDDKADLTAASATVAQQEKEGKYTEAIAGYSDILAVKPLKVWAWSHRGVVYYKTYRYPEAIADFTTAITVSSINKDVDNQVLCLANRAAAHYESKQYEMALNDAELALKINPTFKKALEVQEKAKNKLEINTNLLKDLGITEARQKIEKSQKSKDTNEFSRESKEARKLLDSLRISDPNNAEVWYLSGVVTIMRDNLLSKEKAIRFYDKAIELKPDYADAYYYRGKTLRSDVLAKAEQKKKGEADIEKAIVLWEKDLPKTVTEKTVVAKKARLKEREEQRRLRRLPNPKDASANSEDSDEPEGSQYSKASEGDPFGAGSFFVHTPINKYPSDTRTDKEVFLEASHDIALEIADDENYTDRTAIYLEVKFYDKALLEATKAISLNKKNALAYYMRAQAYENTGKWELALADYAFASQLNPSKATYALEEGNICIMESFKKYDQAIAAYDRVLKLKPNSKEAKENRAFALEKKNGKN